MSAPLYANVCEMDGQPVYTSFGHNLFEMIHDAKTINAGVIRIEEAHAGKPPVWAREWEPINPRYLNYCRVHGRAPDDQRAYDRKRWPGGQMAGYILWNRARLQEYSKVNPRAFMCGGLTDHDAYDLWLSGVPVGHGVEP